MATTRPIVIDIAPSSPRRAQLSTERTAVAATSHRCVCPQLRFTAPSRRSSESRGWDLPRHQPDRSYQQTVSYDRASGLIYRDAVQVEGSPVTSTPPPGLS